VNLCFHKVYQSQNRHRREEAWLRKNQRLFQDLILLLNGTLESKLQINFTTFFSNQVLLELRHSVRN
jgi:hypothetical protein